MSEPAMNAAARASAAAVLRHYSTSFSWAVRLLDRPNRERIRAIYALVRLADEIVDTPGRAREQAAAELAAFRTETYTALRTGYSSNLVIHAFARTSRQCGIGADLLEPFFTSMRTDLDVRDHNRSSHDEYVYGSAEVVGLMCLRSFLCGTNLDFDELAPGAQRLGAAFQKVNFLRDLAGDRDELHRSYLPGVDAHRLTEADRDVIAAEIRADLEAAGPALARLPWRCRIAVRAAHGLFAELNRRLARTPVEALRHTRVRVPNPVKARILVAALYTRPVR